MFNIRVFTIGVTIYSMGFLLDAVAVMECPEVFIRFKVKWDKVFSRYHEALSKLIEAGREYHSAKAEWNKAGQKWKKRQRQTVHFIERDLNDNEAQKITWNLKQHSEKLHKSFARWRRASIRWNQNRELSTITRE